MVMALTDTLCLTLYERGLSRHAIDRALLLATSADATVDWADQPLGRRDACLLDLRCAWFGPRFEAVLACPRCQQLLELAIDLRDISARAPTHSLSDDIQVAGGRFRPPTARDLAAITTEPNAALATQHLLRRLRLDGPAATTWTDDETQAIEDAIDSADPLAHISLAVGCEHCGHGWQAPLDIAASLWDELAALARDVVAQVHELASAYGWSERDILAMPATRRALYLQQVRA